MDRFLVTQVIVDSLRLIQGGRILAAGGVQNNPFPNPSSLAEHFPELPNDGTHISASLFDSNSPDYVPELDDRQANFGVSPWRAIGGDAYTFQNRVYKVLDEFRYLDDINEFPTICVTPSFEKYYHSGDDSRYSRLGFDLRAYVFADENQGHMLLNSDGSLFVNSDGNNVWVAADPTSLCETLSDDIEHVLHNLHNPIVDEVQDALEQLQTIQTSLRKDGDYIDFQDSFLHAPLREINGVQVNSIRPYIQDLRIHEIELDEGLNEPFGVLLMKFSVLFLRH